MDAMFRAFLILLSLVFITSAQSNGKNYRTIIHSSFPINAPLQFDPNNNDHLVLSIVKPSPNEPLKSDDKHRLRIINIDHKLIQPNPNQKPKTAEIESVFGRAAVEQNESGSTANLELLNRQPAIDYGLPKTNQNDASVFFTSPKTKYQKLAPTTPMNSRLFVSKIPTVEELLEKGYVLTDVFPLEFTSDDSEFEFPSDRFFRLPPNNAGNELRVPQKKLQEFKSKLEEGSVRDEDEPKRFQSKIGSTAEDEFRPLEVKNGFLPSADHLGKKYVTKFVGPADSYEAPKTGSQGFDIRRTTSRITQNKQQISAKNEKAEVNTFASLKTQSVDEAAGSNVKTQEASQSQLTNDKKGKNGFIASLFGDGSAKDVKSRLSSSKLEDSKSTSTSARLGKESQSGSLRKNTSEKLDEATRVKAVTSSSSSSNFEKSTSVKTQEEFGARAFERAKVGSTQAGGLPKTPKFAIYYKTSPTLPNDEFGLPKPHDHVGDNILHKRPVELPHFISPNLQVESHKYAGPTLDSKSSVIKSLEDFTRPKDFAIYYKTPRLQPDDFFLKSIDRYDVPKTHGYFSNLDGNLFLGLPSNPTASHEAHKTDLSLSTPEAPRISVVFQSNPLVSAAYELPNFDKPIVFEDRPSTEATHTEYGVPHVSMPSTIYGTPSTSLPTGSIDIRRPFAVYGLPTTEATVVTKEPSESIGQGRIDIRTQSKPRVVILKPSLEYGTPGIKALRQEEFGVPVLKVPNTRPLSSYEVPVY